MEIFGSITDADNTAPTPARARTGACLPGGRNPQRTEPASRTHGRGMAEDDAVLAGFFGFVERAGGAREGIGPAGILGTAAGHAEAGGEGHRALRPIHRGLVDLRAYPAGQFLQRVHRERARAKYGELLAAQP